MTHYTGLLGDFDYDENTWVVTNDPEYKETLAFNRSYQNGPVYLPQGVKCLARAFFNCDIPEGVYLAGKWDLRSVEQLDGMFYGANIPKDFFKECGGFETEGVKYMSKMFAKATIADIRCMNPITFVIGESTDVHDFAKDASLFVDDEETSEVKYFKGFICKYDFAKVLDIPEASLKQCTCWSEFEDLVSRFIGQ